MFRLFEEFINEQDSKFPHKVHPESYWRKVTEHSKFATAVLDTVLKKQNGFASDKQMNILRRAASGEKEKYSVRN